MSQVCEIEELKCSRRKADEEEKVKRAEERELADTV